MGKYLTDTFVKPVDRFLFKSVSPLPLSVFRIVFGAVMIYYFLNLAPFLMFYYDGNGVLRSPEVAGYFLTRGNFAFLEPAALLSMYVLTLVSSLCLCIGLFTRFFSVMLWTLFAAWVSPMSFGMNGGDLVIRNLIFLFMLASLFGHTQRVLSVDGYLSPWIRNKLKLRPLSREIPLWSTRLFQFQLVVIYLFTGLAKLEGTLWYQGTALHYVFQRGFWLNIDMSWAVYVPFLTALATYGVLAFETILFPVLVWPSKTRNLILTLGLCLHAGIGLTMRVFVFSWIMPIFYLCFLTEQHWERFGKMIGRLFLRHAHNESTHPRVLFDGVCNLCNGTIRFIIQNDPTHIFRFATLQSGAASQPPVTSGTSADAPETILLVEDGRTYEKSSAILRILSHLRFPWPLMGIFLLVPRVIRDGVYTFVAKHRYQWFGKQNTCMLPTPETEVLFLK